MLKFRIIKRLDKTVTMQLCLCANTSQEAIPMTLENFF